MNGKIRYKWCFVPECKNTTMKTPTKSLVPKVSRFRKIMNHENSGFKVRVVLMSQDYAVIIVAKIISV